MSIVQCAKCGYLGLRDVRSREICEAEPELRNGGTINDGGPHGRNFIKTPLCFQGRPDFLEIFNDVNNLEIEKTSTRPGFREAYLREVLNQPRTCGEFTPWIQGFTPKEHAEANREKEQREWEKKWQEQLATQQREWRKKDEAWQEELRNQDREWRKEDITLVKKGLAGQRNAYLYGGIIGFAAAIAGAVIGALLNHWLK